MYAAALWNFSCKNEVDLEYTIFVLLKWKLWKIKKQPL